MLRVNQLIGFGEAQGGTWQTVTTRTLNADVGAGWSGYTVRCFFPQTDLAVTGGSLVRFTVQCPSVTGTSLAAMYFGGATSGYSETAPVFAATPTQVLFSGSGAIELSAAGVDVVSDAVAGSIPAADGLLVSFYVSGAGSRIRGHVTLPTGGRTSYKNASDASTVSASGYTSNTDSSHAYLVNKVEVFA